ncbi:hypothetical protein AX17_006202 [Amanita inopinata Kibby_2008]|nr:hypothetical protein AX17_006202 [Amanita inopinata Kibby_2008]
MTHYCPRSDMESPLTIRALWAGWRDAPLSLHGETFKVYALPTDIITYVQGMNQARALARAFSDTRFTVILTSTLIRTSSTAQALQDAQTDPKPPISSSLLLREQYFGVAEGKPYGAIREGLSLEEHFAKGKYPSPRHRNESFPNGESRADLAQRAEQVVNEILMPYVHDAVQTGSGQSHVAVVSHGLLIREIATALMRKDIATVGGASVVFRGLRNTGWIRIAVQMVQNAGQDIVINPSQSTMRVQVTDYERYEHLDGLVRQRAGIGSIAHDPKQRDIRSFFRNSPTPENKEKRPKKRRRQEPT